MAKLELTLEESPRAGSLHTHKCMWALAEIRRDRKLHATYLACCIYAGRNGFWGVWTPAGKFVRFHRRRSDIEDTYPRLVWRRVASRWAFASIENAATEADHLKVINLR